MLLIPLATTLATTLLSVSALPAPSWVPTFLPAHRIDGPVHHMVTFDDGGGRALYAGGAFRRAGGRRVGHVARWDGAAWSSLGTGTDGWVEALAVFDDGSGAGPCLFAGGTFKDAGGMPCNNIARWDGNAWSPLGSGTNGQVAALTVFDDGSGPALYAGGTFLSAGGAPASNVAKWDGSSWTPVGDGLLGIVLCLQVFDSGGGPELYVGGSFFHGVHPELATVARLRGSRWFPVGGDIAGGASHLGVYDEGAGPRLFAGGTLHSKPGAPHTYHALARFELDHWEPVGGGLVGFNPLEVAALHVFDDGAGPKLHLAGTFTQAGGVATSRLASWDGAAFAPLGGGIDDRGICLTTFVSPLGKPALFVGGKFKSSGSGDPFIAVWSR